MMTIFLTYYKEKWFVFWYEIELFQIFIYYYKLKAVIIGVHMLLFARFFLLNITQKKSWAKVDNANIWLFVCNKNKQ